MAAEICIEILRSIVLQARGVEDRFVGRRLSKGTKPPQHPLVTSEDLLKQFVQEPEPVQL